MTIKKIILILVLLLITMVGVLAYKEISKATSEDPTVWENDIASFEQTLTEKPAEEGALVFIGSSSIRLWDTLAEDMQPFSVVQRGFGGAKFLDVVHYAERLIDIGVTPSAFVVFVGTNDIHPGAVKEPDVLLQRYQQFTDVVRSKHADVPVYFIAITPSVLRWEVWSNAQQTNQLIKEYAAGQNKLFVIDTGPELLGSDGSPDPDLYQFDGLHLSAAGYAKWTGLILPRLLADLRPEG